MAKYELALVVFRFLHGVWKLSSDTSIEMLFKTHQPFVENKLI